MTVTAVAPRPLGAILAGGRARRMGGADKPLLEVGGRPMLAAAHAALAAHLDEVVVLGGSPRPGLPGLPGLRVIADRRPDAPGPLAGLEAALLELAARPRPRPEAVVLLGGDMPFVSAALVERLLASAPGAAAVCFESEHGLEPLCARYALSLLPRVSARLDAGIRPLRALLEEAGAVRLPVVSDDERRALANVNTPEDLAAARALLASGQR